jgi:aminoglycoside phosphotransferase (APT) family kinase protein
LPSAIAKQGASLDEVTEPRFVEWDLWDGNVMVKDGSIVSIIDHERAFYGDPLIEGYFTGTVLRSFDYPSAFLRGYGHSQLTGAELTRRRLYTLHLMLVMVIETVYRGHTDAAQYDWARQQLTDTMALFGRHPR